MAFGHAIAFNHLAFKLSPSNLQPWPLATRSRSTIQPSTFNHLTFNLQPSNLQPSTI
ncbi:hypothetical protein [Moorena sp. SIO2C4]|uniref:hypothetical protein n=1 Tax=Moorena sp. SIO2C4 TaxID=2607824 RepID=UPI0013CAE51B|nr:hypothetical protein [Moorena sp. SIO2C4]NES41039.1 hypothetical protein [Moorena sp. SIO2C4]